MIPHAIALLGFSRQKVRAMIESASAIDNGQLNLESLAEVSDDVALAKLLELRGVDDGPLSMCSCEDWDDCTSFLAMTWELAIT